MIKKHLDTLYEARALYKSEIETLIKLNEQPRAQCCKDMSHKLYNDGELDAKKQALSRIDGIIESFVKLTTQP